VKCVLKEADKSYTKKDSFRKKQSKALKKRIEAGDILCNTFEFWHKKYGLEVAEMKEKKRKEKLSKAFSGENNPMFGKPSPIKSGNGWGGWYKGWFFRSFRELSYMVNVIEKQGLEWRSAESQEFAIKYSIDGDTRTYFPDFFLVNNNTLIECKPQKLINSKISKLKAEAAQTIVKRMGCTI
jgi:hypothetical protein